MRLLITVIITALLAWLTSYMFAWWMIAVIPFLIAVVWKHKPGFAFISGALSIAILWALLITLADAANEHILSSRMAQLFGLSHTVFIAVNIILGAIVGGLGGWSGAHMNRLFKEHK